MTNNSPQAVALTLHQAAAAFRDADFFESAALYWSVALSQSAATINNFSEDLLEFGYDLEQELGLDVQQQEPIELVYPQTFSTGRFLLRQQQRKRLHGSMDQQDDLAEESDAAIDQDQQLRQEAEAEEEEEEGHAISLGRGSTPPLYVYILTALAYLSRQINIRIDILPSGNGTLTSLGPPQRYYGALSSDQQVLYHDMLAIVLATSLRMSSYSSHHFDNGDTDPWHHSTTVLGNEVTATWQIMIPQKRTPHSLPRFFSYLNPSAATVAGCSTLRNELDVAAMAASGVRLVVTLIKESPLPQAWFPSTHTVTIGAQQHQQEENGYEAAITQPSETPADPNGAASNTEEPAPPPVVNAFVPIENLKAPGFPEIFETILGWCVRTTPAPSPSSAPHPHQHAILIHCGGGKGRAGVVLAAHLMRFGLAGHGGRGYCRSCVAKSNLHPYDLGAFRRGQGEQQVVFNALPVPCSNLLEGDDDNEEDSDEDEEDNGYLDTTVGVYVVKAQQCVNQYTPKMTAKDAMAYLRAIRPGSIETTIQEKALKAYGDWLWKRAAKRGTEKTVTGRRASDYNSVEQAESQQQQNESVSEQNSSNHSKAMGRKGSKGKDTSTATQQQKQPKQKRSTATTPAKAVELNDVEEEDDSEDDGGRRSKKTKNKKQQQQEEKKFVPPPANKIIKLPSGGKGSHHQHHLIVQHNMRARQLQRGQKKNKGGSDKNGKSRKDEPISFRIVGAPLDPSTPPPKLIVMTGLPGSGKSHLVQRLLQKYPEHFVQISQDELGSRAVCERLLAQSMRHQQQSASVKGSPALALPMSVIVDRCNPTYVDRKSWYETAFQPDETCMIWFSADQDTCLERVESREGHPTLPPGKGARVIKSFAKEFETPDMGKEGAWCKTLVEVGDFEGADQIFQVLGDLAAAVPGSAMSKKNGTATMTTAANRAARPAFIPTKVLQRRQQLTSTGGSGDTATSAGMDKVEEEEEEEDEEDEINGNDTRGNNEKKDTHLQETGEEASDTDPESNNEQEDTDTSLAKALQFASPTGHRPAFKKPARGSYQGNNIQKQSTENGGNDGVSLSKGVKFASPISSYARPMQKFPRTPHLFDPLRFQSSSLSTADKASSPAISRNDLLLPPSALDQVFCPKPKQVLTVEEKMDGANLGFSVLHFKSMSSSTLASEASLPPPKIRIQNRSHFINADDHWQFKKLDQWLDKYRDDVLWLCEGRWRYEVRDGTRPDNGGEHEQGDDERKTTQDDDTANDEEVDEKEEMQEDDGDEAWQDTRSENDDEEDENEYVDEDRVLQDGLAAYVLYGEWLYAKHSIQYTGLDSWFVPFDLLDVKTGTFVSRKVFSRAIAQTKLRGPPQLVVPEEVQGDKTKMTEWVLQTLESTSQLMGPTQEKDGQSSNKKNMTRGNQQATSGKGERRVEGLYFRIDQGNRLLMRCKVVRPDFIAGEERWGTKEQVANELKWDAYL